MFQNFYFKSHQIFRNFPTDSIVPFLQKFLKEFLRGFFFRKYSRSLFENFLHRLLQKLLQESDISLRIHQRVLQFAWNPKIIPPGVPKRNFHSVSSETAPRDEKNIHIIVQKSLIFKILQGFKGNSKDKLWGNFTGILLFFFSFFSVFFRDSFRKS